MKLPRTSKSSGLEAFLNGQNSSDSLATPLLENLFSKTGTNSSNIQTVQSPSFTLRNLWEAKLTIMGFEVVQNPAMPDNCIMLKTKKEGDIGWYNFETGKFAHIPAMSTELELELKYDPPYPLLTIAMAWCQGIKIPGVKYDGA